MTTPPLASTEAGPLPWVARFAGLIAAPRRVLDLAAGRGRHARWLMNAGCTVLAVDRDADALATFMASETMVADLEGESWPLSGRRFEAVVVTNYLYRARLPELLDCVEPGGILIYQTFSLAQASIGKPSSPDFLLRPGELLRWCSGMHVIAFEDGYVEEGTPAFVQRICARASGSTLDMMRDRL